jgi:hypothetical protein
LRFIDKFYSIIINPTHSLHLHLLHKLNTRAGRHVLLHQISLPSSFAQTAAEQAQLRIRNCQATIETPDFNNEYNFAVNDQTAWSQRYTYSYEGKYLSQVRTCIRHELIQRFNSLPGYTRPIFSSYELRYRWNLRHMHLVSTLRRFCR